MWLSGKESACIAGAAGDSGLIPRWGRLPREENGKPLQVVWEGLSNLYFLLSSERLPCTQRGKEHLYFQRWGNAEKNQNE